MNRFVIAALAAITLAGCQTSQEGAPGIAKQCEAPKDTVITVQDGTNPVVDQDPINVCAKNVKITWVLNSTQTSMYEFRADSIVVRDNDAEFANCKGKGNGGDLDGTSKIKCTDLNNKHGSGSPRRPYKYDIKIYRAGSSATDNPVATYDPSIVND